jgi:tyrosyl-tRNA synthetase
MAPHKFEVRRNGEWFADMSFANILRLAGKMTLARMLEREDFTKRWKAEAPISIHELLYPLMQAYDSVMIRADVELGATEQKFNLLTGRQIQEAYGVEPQVALTFPLLEGTDGTQKMGKSVGNYIGITESPKEMFGKIMSIPDRLIMPYFHLVTNHTQAQIGKIDAAMKAGENPVSYKKELGRAIVGMYYDVQAAEEAQGEFEKVSSRREAPTTFVVREYVTSKNMEWLPRLLVDSGIATSTSEARRKIEGGAIDLDNLRVSDVDLSVDTSMPHTIRYGKRHFYEIRKKDSESGD